MVGLQVFRSNKVALAYKHSCFVRGSNVRFVPVTPPKFNMEPKNEGLEDVFPFHMGDSQVPS